MKRNNVEMMANIVNEPKIIENATFLRVAIWNGTNDDNKGKEYPSVFVDVSFFGKLKTKVDEMKLTKGTPVNIEAYLSNRKEKVNDKEIERISLTGRNITIITTKDKKDDPVTDKVLAEFDKAIDDINEEGKNE